jgi:CO/xanthine dehydrogenase FAD-binding subunit
MPLWKNYLLPQSIDEALAALSSAPEPSRLVGGGTDLLLDLQQGRHPPVDTLVDVTAIPELGCLELRGGQLFIGAAVPLRKIAASPLVNGVAQALAEACLQIGGPQVRNAATLGGNVAHALPAGDGTIALAALGAQAEVTSRIGRKRVSILDLFRGPGKSALDPRGELLVGFYVQPAGEAEGSAFAPVMRPQGVALPILNMAAWLRIANGCVTEVRLAVGPAGPTPQRVPAAERVLTGRPLSQATLDQALYTLLEAVHYRNSPHRASADYRRHLSRTLLEQVLTTAYQRAEARRKDINTNTTNGSTE